MAYVAMNYQFIKEHGVDKAREIVEGAPEGATHLSDDACHYVNADFKPLPAHIKEQLPKLVDLYDLKRGSWRHTPFRKSSV